MRTIETKIYTIEDHPNVALCYDWIRDIWLDLNQHSVEEVVDSLKALQAIIGGELDYSISQVPDRGEHITFTNYDRDALCRLSADDLPLTGVCWDHQVITGLREYNPERVLKSLHDDTEYVYSDEGLKELCESNGYEFTETGSIF
tara:strand:+ start:1172 stop:1606 length:435 start_codon:yes stop_codon:yes gene_type:complete